MNIVVLQQSPDTPPGSVLEWTQTKGHSTQVVRLFEGESLPSLEDVDFLVILGGGMNVDETDKHPFLIEEKTYLKSAIAMNKTCLGLCLGGQLLSQVLGGEVRRHDHWEVGWFPVSFEDGDSVTVLHFHQDTFSLPPGARNFASNVITTNQGFRYGDHVVGLQFHPEGTADWVHMLTTEDPYPGGPFVQSPEELTEGLVHLPGMKKWFFGLLDQLEAETRQRAMKALRSFDSNTSETRA